MKVIIEFGYAKYLFPVEVIPLLGNIVEVESQYVQNKTKFFTKEKNLNEIKINLVKDSDVIDSESKEAEQSYKQMYEDKDKANNDLYSRMWAEEKKNKELEAKIKALQELCPDSHKKEEDNA